MPPRGKHTYEKNNRGFALLVVILIIGVLAAMVGEFLFGVRLHAELLANHRNGMKCRYIGRSSVNTFMYLLKMDLVRSNSQQNLLVLSSWVGYGGGLENVEGAEFAQEMLGFEKNPLDPDPNGPLRGQWSIPLPSEVFELDGKMYGKLINERGKINLNSIVTVTQRRDRTEDVTNYKVYNRLFQLFQLLDIEEEESLTCIDGIVDWIDGNLGTEPRGAEEDYYRSLDNHPYYSRNDFLQSVDEIMLVRGCTPQITEKIREFVTVYPHKGNKATAISFDSRIDAVTAPKVVLMAMFMAPSDESGISAVDEELAAQIAEEIYEKAIEKSGISVSVSEEGAYSVSAPSLLSAAEVKQVVANRLPEDSLDLYAYSPSEAQFYTVKGYGEVNGVMSGVEVVLRKIQREVEILSWRED